MDNNEKDNKVEVVDEEKVHFTRCINALRAYRLKLCFIFYTIFLYSFKGKIFLLIVFLEDVFNNKKLF